MPVLLATLVGIVGALLAVTLELPIPWLLGSLFACAIGAVAGLPLGAPPAALERWARVAIGVSLGPGVAASLVGHGAELPFALLAAVGLTGVMAVAGTRWFEARAALPRPQAFLAALPGGLSMLLAMAGDLGAGREQVLLIHTVRVVIVVVFVSLLARALGIPPVPDPLAASFALAGDAPWPALAALIVGGFLVSERLAVPGVHVILPMLVTGLLAGLGDLPLDSPPIVKTLAMLVFGTVLGCEVAAGSRERYLGLASASAAYTLAALLLAAALALGLSGVIEPSFLVLFLAFAPGGIAEVSLVALALGLDAGLVAMVHTCRFLFIVLAGPVGLSRLERRARERDRVDP